MTSHRPRRGRHSATSSSSTWCSAKNSGCARRAGSATRSSCPGCRTTRPSTSSTSPSNPNSTPARSATWPPWRSSTAKQHRPARPTRRREDPHRHRARRRRLPGRLLDLLHQPRRLRPPTPRRRSRRPVRQETPDLPAARRPRRGRGRLPALRPGRGEHGLPAVSRRYERGSIILTTNKTFTEWGQRLRRRSPRHRHPRPAPAPLRRHRHQRPQLPTQRPAQPRHRRHVVA